MLFKLSIRNIKRSLKDYLIYFFTLVLGVAVFYVFNSLESQSIMLNVSENTHDLISMMTNIMSVLSVFVAIVFGFLIIYASRFLMKRRKREFGIYMTLGMGKGQISRILLLETLVIGLVSLGVGLVLGIFASQLMSVFVANLFEADMTNFQFVFSESALITTMIMFGIIYLVVMAFNTISVSKQKLINLIHSDKENEKIKIRNLAVSLVVFAISVLLLAKAYYEVTANFANITDESIIASIVMGIVGTFLFFWSWSGLALRLIMRLKKFYFKNLNTFVFRELNSKINTTVVSMSIISLLLFLTICIFSSAMSIKNSITENLQNLVPADAYAIKYMNTRDDDEYEPEEIRKGNLDVMQTMSELDVNIDEYFSEYVTAKTYRNEAVTYNETIGLEAMNSSKSATGLDEYSFLGQTESIIKQSEYNAIAKIYNNETISLANDEYAVVANYDAMVDIRNYALKERSPKITIDGRELTPNKHEVIDGFIEMSSNEMNMGIIIVPDDIDLGDAPVRSVFIGNYIGTDEEEKVAIEKALDEKLSTSDVVSDYWLFFDTKIYIYENSIGLSAMVTFIGLYLGVIFLITSAALLGLKEISESSDNQSKYKTLRDLGVDQKSMNRALLAQISIFFGMPLAVAIVHSIFGITFANKIISTFASVNLLSSIIMTAALIVAIYGGYFLVTYQTSKRIIISRK